MVRQRNKNSENYLLNKIKFVLIRIINTNRDAEKGPFETNANTPSTPPAVISPTNSARVVSSTTPPNTTPEDLRPLLTNA